MRQFPYELIGKNSGTNNGTNGGTNVGTNHSNLLIITLNQAIVE